MLWVIQLERPVSTSTPRVSIELASDDLFCRLGPGTQIVRSSMNSSDPFSAFYEFNDGVLRLALWNLEVGRVVKQYEIILGEVLSSEYAVVIRGISRPCTRFFA